MKNTFLRLNDALYLACLWIAGIAIVVMSVIIPWGIFTRYVLGTGSQWPEPVAILMMVVFTFLGAAVSYRAGAHIAVAMLTDRLPAAARQRAGRGRAPADAFRGCLHAVLRHQAVHRHLGPDHR